MALRCGDFFWGVAFDATFPKLLAGLLLCACCHCAKIYSALMATLSFRPWYYMWCLFAIEFFMSWTATLKARLPRARLIWEEHTWCDAAGVSNASFRLSPLPLNVFYFLSKALPFQTSSVWSPFRYAWRFAPRFPLVLVYNYLVFMLPSKGFVLVLRATVGAT